MVQALEPPARQADPSLQMSTEHLLYARSPFTRTAKPLKKLEGFYFHGFMVCLRGRLAPQWQSPPDFAFFVRPHLVQALEPPARQAGPLG
ncbi:hypothetical protein BST85_00245 [Aureitalea marina]|uniref:Uncharacterized protein n=1 Tax=Aureitalea marina TaxID=930804 RepID=A0A2S7KLJ2_9FLAO|nr:hypothetical protein BST85_00245 [Aureitalea marina]